MIEILMMMVNTDLSSRPTQKSTAFVFRVVSKVKMAPDLGAASLPNDCHCLTVKIVSSHKVWRVVLFCPYIPFSARLVHASLAVE